MKEFSQFIEAAKQLYNGIDPFTGEVFDHRELYDNADLANALMNLYYVSTGRKKPESRNRLNRPSKRIFEELKAWRLEKAKELGMPAYIVFSDKELWNIAEGDVCAKEELLLVRGISIVKYEEYGDDIMDILLPYIQKDKVDGTFRGKNPKDKFAKERNDELEKAEMFLKVVEEEEAKKGQEKNCIDCMEYRRGNCINTKETCEDFKRAYNPTDEEKANWPEMGYATWIKLYGKHKD